MKCMSRPKRDAVKNIDITNNLGQKYRYRINIGTGDRPTSSVYNYPKLPKTTENRILCQHLLVNSIENLKSGTNRYSSP